MGRPAFKITPGNPGSDVAGNTASAFAIGAIVFKDKGQFSVLNNSVSFINWKFIFIKKKS